VIEQLLAFLISLGAACTPIQSEYLIWGANGQAIVEMATVPADKVWLVRASGVFTTDSNGAEYMMELVRPVESQGGACCWRIPLTRSVGLVKSTPVLALERPLTLLPGERLAARASGLDSIYQMGIAMVYYELPKTCLGL